MNKDIKHITPAPFSPSTDTSPRMNKFVSQFSLFGANISGTIQAMGVKFGCIQGIHVHSI